MEMELKEVRHQLSLKEFQYESIKIEFESEVKELKDHLSATMKDKQVLELEVKRIQEKFEDELQSIMIQLESSNKNVNELDSQLSFCRKENEDIVTDLHKVQNELASCRLELQLTKTQLESSNNKIIEFEELVSSYVKERNVKEEELVKLQDLHSITMNDQLQSLKILFEFVEAKEVEDQCLDQSYVNESIEIVDE